MFVSRISFPFTDQLATRLECILIHPFFSYCRNPLRRARFIIRFRIHRPSKNRASVTIEWKKLYPWKSPSFYWILRNASLLLVVVFFLIFENYIHIFILYTSRNMLWNHFALFVCLNVSYIIILHLSFSIPYPNFYEHMPYNLLTKIKSHNQKTKEAHELYAFNT